MQAILKEHGPRWLILIFFLIMFSALAVSIKFLVEDTHQLQWQITELKETQQLSQTSVLSTQEKLMWLEKKVEEQDKLIAELEKMMNYKLDQ